MFSLLNGIFAIIRIDAIFPIVDETDVSVRKFEIMFVLEAICLYGATWFFSIKYFETASDLRYMLHKYPSSLNHSKYLSRTHKRNCRIFRWTVFLVIVVCIGLMTFSLNENLKPKTKRAFLVTPFIMLLFIMLLIAWLEALALYRFIKIVKSLPVERRELNQGFIVV